LSCSFFEELELNFPLEKITKLLTRGGYNDFETPVTGYNLGNWRMKRFLLAITLEWRVAITKWQAAPDRP
jgi:hypothetical protein